MLYKNKHQIPDSLQTYINEKQIPDFLFERGVASFTSLVIFILYGDATSHIYERSTFIKTAIKD